MCLFFISLVVWRFHSAVFWSSRSRFGATVQREAMTHGCMVGKIFFLGESDSYRRFLRNDVLQISNGCFHTPFHRHALINVQMNFNQGYLTGILKKFHSWTDGQKVKRYFTIQDNDSINFRSKKAIQRLKNPFRWRWMVETAIDS